MTFSERVLTEEDDPPLEYSEIFGNPQEDDPPPEYGEIFGNSQEDAFDQVAKIIAEAEEKIMGTDEERKERERGSMKRFFKEISLVD